MAYTYKDLIWETTSTSGTGPCTMLGAVAGGYYAFSTCGNGTIVPAIQVDSSGNYETGYYLVTVSGGTTTLTRQGSPLASSNAGAAVNWLAGGTRNVRLCPVAGTYIDKGNAGSEWSGVASTFRSNLNAAPGSLEGQSGGTNGKVIRLHDSTANTWQDATNADTNSQLACLGFKAGGLYYTTPGALVPRTVTNGQRYWLGTAGDLLTSAPTPSASLRQKFIGVGVGTATLLFLPGITIGGS